MSMRDPLFAYVQDIIEKIKIIILATKITTIAVVSLNVGKVQFSYKKRRTLFMRPSPS